jgi:hypothetical protein
MATVTLLVEHGADVNARSARCGMIQTPLWRAVAHYELTARNQNEPDHSTSSTKYLPGFLLVGGKYNAPFLLRKGADLNFCDPRHGTPPL